MVLRACLCVLAGVFAPQLSSFPFNSDLFLPQLVLLAGISILLLPHVRQSDLLWFFFAAALFWSAGQDAVDERLERRFAGDSIQADVRILDFPANHGSGARFMASPLADERLPETLSLSWHEPPVLLHAGDIWRLEMRLRRPRASSNPGSFDYEAWMFQKGIDASGYVVSGQRNTLLDSDTATSIQRLRLDYLEFAESVLGHEAAFPVVAAVAVGVKQRIEPQAWERYARTGTSHLIAISGLHVGLAAIAAYLFGRGLLGVGGVRNPHTAALLFGLLVALGYAAISGFAVPARRATLMLAIATVALLLRREVKPLALLAATAIFSVLYDPLSTISAGFKLSFAAVAALLVLASRRPAFATRNWHRPILLLRNMLLMQLVLLVGLLPLLAGIFDRVSLAAPLINLLAVPLFSIVTVPAVLLSLVSATLCEPFAVLCLQAAAKSIDLIEAVIAIVADQQFAAVPVASPRGWVKVWVLASLLWLLLPPGWPGRSAAVLATFGLLLWKPAPPPENCFDLRVLDVGQGLSVFVRTAHEDLVYDPGPAWRGGGDAAERVLLPYLHSVGVRRLARLIVSHADLDHAGGTASLLAALEVEQVLAGEPLAIGGREAEPCRRGMSWTSAGVRFSVLSPAADAAVSGNDASCVILIEAGEQRVLLSGDIESPAEAELVRSRLLPQVAVVTVPHHGSRTSSTPAFVQSLRPDVAIVAAGYKNRWGFPKSEVVSRWRAAGATVLNTATSGSIGLRMCAGEPPADILGWRKRSQRIWHETDS